VLIDELPVEHVRYVRPFSSTALATPRIRARSPPMRTWTFLVPVRGGAECAHVDELVRNDGPSRRRLDERIDMDELARPTVGLGQQVSMRGAFVAALSPISQIASACSQSARSTVPCRCEGSRERSPLAS